MSENLKRAESLFNRIINQNKPQESRPSYYGKSNNGGSGHHSHSHRDTSASRDQPYTNGLRYKSYNLKNTHHHNNLSIVPHRDPVKEAKDAVAKVPPQHHVLQYCWTAWHHLRNSKPKPDEVTDWKHKPVDSYLQLTSEIRFKLVGAESRTKENGEPEEDDSTSTTAIASLEQMWVACAELKKAHEMGNRSELLIFKTGVSPVWEDPLNSRGGRWVFRFAHKYGGDDAGENTKRVRMRTTLIWERLMLRVMSGLFLREKRDLLESILNDVAGIVLSIRRDEDIISVWNFNLNFWRRSDDDNKKPLTPFQGRRIICDAVLRIIRECDMILQGLDPILTSSGPSTERVGGVSFEYRLHQDNNYSSGDRPRRKHHHRKDDDDDRERSDRGDRGEKSERESGGEKSEDKTEEST